MEAVIPMSKSYQLKRESAGMGTLLSQLIRSLSASPAMSSPSWEP